MTICSRSMQTAAAKAIAITVPLPPSSSATPAHITPQPRVTAQRGVLCPEETIRASRLRASIRSTRSLSTSRTRWSTWVRSS